MNFRLIAVAAALYAMIALAGATARVPTLDAGILDWHKESNSAYGEPDDIALMDEGIVP